jgi:hypothetical protein
MIALTCAGMASVLAWLAACRICAWRGRRRDGRRYEPDALQSSPRAAWPSGRTGLDGLQQLSARDTERQLCGASCGHPDEVAGFEMDLTAPPRAAPDAGSWRWGRAIFGGVRGLSDCETHYACPQQSPGSRHAFAQRLTGPRRASAFPDKITSPGSVDDGAKWTSSQKPTSQNYGHAVRYFGDSAPSASRALCGSCPTACRQVLGPGDVAGADDTERSCARQLSIGSDLAQELTSDHYCPEHNRGAERVLMGVRP